MTNNSTKILLLVTLMSGVLISVSSNSWLGAWIGLEINLLSFIPLMSNNKNVYTTEASMKYFIVQALASSTLLFLVISKSMIEELYISNNSLVSMIINTPLLLKGGAAPFHWWFPSIMEGLSWSNCFILMTIQKMAPLMLISYSLNMDMFMWMIILMSVIIGSVGGLNQISIRKILTYSSINHMGWMLAAMNIGENTWIVYFLIYSTLTLTIVMIVSSNQISFINQTFLMKNEMSTMKFLMFTSLLSLGGLPPFLGFLPKWIVIQHMIINEMNFIISLMVIMSLITLYYYLQICYASFTISYIEPKWNIMFHMNKTIPIGMVLSSISMMGLILCTLLINIF
uniref:NADH dehydrogenase subunit 2 n=1 Tax=Hebardina formosana TaxID=3014038 RepID=UPI0022FDAEFF|nr:NADH dehydrogenase subunit 2 [Hebardina formosana]WAX39402.1 NADH dehydrogenase subunit 2 [Hebardina formosana]